MESRFAHLRQRDTSVSMLRVKMSRRRSQAQKENRERTVNTRRQLKAVQELDVSALDASIALSNMSMGQEQRKRNAPLPKNVAGEERLKQLQRWKERKALEKEKEKREKSRKGVFKTGLYHPKDSLTVEPLPPVLTAPGRAKETKACSAAAQSIRVTRSMRQQQPLKMQDVNVAGKKSQPPVGKTNGLRGAPKPSQSKTKESTTRGSSTRSVNKPPVTAAPVLKEKSADVRTTRSKVAEKERPVEAQKSDESAPAHEESIPKPEPEVEKQNVRPPNTLQSEEEAAAVASFAPEGFLFQAPVGLSSFKFDPMTPRSVDAFLTPSSSFTCPPAPVFDDEPKAEQNKPSPSKSLRRSPTPAPESTEEPKHDVPYFRSETVKESDRLTGLCSHWEHKFEDESIPEEMRDRMRTAVGQARLLMKERFKQFRGLVDDCELGRGEKITTCSDLQGFWDMVYFQVEDVNKKFDALKEAEARGWVEESKAPPRQRKVVKKAAPALSKPAGANAAAKSRLAAVKAAMKARQQAAQGSEQHAQAEAAVANTDTFIHVKSPAKPPGSVRRSSRLSAMAPPQQSPSSHYVTPRRATRRSLASALTPVQTKTNVQPTTPSHPCPVNESPAQRPQSAVGVSLRFSPVKEPSTEPTEDSVSKPVQTISDEQENPAEDVDADVNMSLPQCLCKSPVPGPVPSVSLSFTRTPCAPRGSPAVSPTPRAASDTPDGCVDEEMPGIDFERYLQPSQRDSLSPRRPFALESPMAMDVDVESPRVQPEKPLTQQEAVSITLPSVPTSASSQSPQTAESAMLLFTPDLKDRIRQSVCPSDLMVFTPPHL